MKFEQEWKSYEAEVLPRDAADVQRIECRRAFYAGAQALFGLVIRGLTPGPDSTPADEVMMGELLSELEAFKNEVVGGRA